MFISDPKSVCKRQQIYVQMDAWKIRYLFLRDSCPDTSVFMHLLLHCSVGTLNTVIRMARRGVLSAYGLRAVRFYLVLCVKKVHCPRPVKIYWAPFYSLFFRAQAEKIYIECTRRFGSLDTTRVSLMMGIYMREKVKVKAPGLTKKYI